jgi:hypothetical protein
MAKEKPKAEPKKRAEKYDPKVKFDGSLEDMIKIAIKPIHNKKKTDGGGVSGG